MRRKGYQLTRWADDWVITCQSAAEARAAVTAARKVLEQLGVQLHRINRIVHVQPRIRVLGYKIKRGQGRLRLAPTGFVAGEGGALYAYRARNRFDVSWTGAGTNASHTAEDQELIIELNPLLRGGASITSAPTSRKLFHRLDGWITRRIWRIAPALAVRGWKDLPAARLYGEYGLVNLFS